MVCSGEAFLRLRARCCEFAYNDPEVYSICRSLFSWTNDGSHSIPDDLEFSEDNDSSEKFKKVFKDVFYNTHNQYHYDRMME